MAPSYYVIELTARWLAALLAALAGVMILAFVFGYGAAWSVLDRAQRPVEVVAAGPPQGTPTPTPVEVRIGGGDPSPTAGVPIPATATPEPPPTATPRPVATPEPRPTEPPEARSSDFWVQVLASSSPDAVAKAQGTLADLGFSSGRQLVVRGQAGDGNELLKLRVGPFPDRDSADRIARRMQESGFSDAWVVAP